MAMVTQGYAMNTQHHTEEYLDVDLELHISSLTPENNELHFLLHSPAGKFPYRHRDMGNITVSNPEIYVEQLFRMIEDSIHNHKASDVDELLQTIGMNLYERLIPVRLKEEFPAFQHARTIQLLTSDHLFPWEMVHPFGVDIESPDFLCSTFDLSRWAPGKPAPPDILPVERSTCIRPSSSGSATGELNFPEKMDLWFRRQANRNPPFTYTTLAPRERAEILQILQQNSFGHIHFAGHGEFSSRRPDDTGISLADGSKLVPSDLRSLHQLTNYPLVFLNICNGARQAWTLSRVDGWIERFMDLGCGAILAPQTTISDRLAFQFSTLFYKNLLRGTTIARATRNARRSLRKLAPGDPTWLAYALYGQPTARLAWRTLSPKILPRSWRQLALEPPLHSTSFNLIKRDLQTPAFSKITALVGDPGTGKTTLINRLTRDPLLGGRFRRIELIQNTQVPAALPGSHSLVLLDRQSVTSRSRIDHDLNHLSSLVSNPQDLVIIEDLDSASIDLLSILIRAKSKLLITTTNQSWLSVLKVQHHSVHQLESPTRATAAGILRMYGIEAETNVPANSMSLRCLLGICRNPLCLDILLRACHPRSLLHLDSALICSLLITGNPTRPTDSFEHQASLRTFIRNITSQLPDELRNFLVKLIEYIPPYTPIGPQMLPDYLFGSPAINLDSLCRLGLIKDSPRGYLVPRLLYLALSSPKDAMNAIA